MSSEPKCILAAYSAVCTARLSLSSGLLSVQMLQKKNKSLRTEIDGHQPRVQAVCAIGQNLIDSGEADRDADGFQAKIDELLAKWDSLQDAVEARRGNLELSEIAQQYFFDASEAEAWMSEQELYMMGEDRAKDELGEWALARRD